MAIRRSRGKPTYDLNEVKALASKGCLFINGRATRFIINRYCNIDAGEFVKEIVESIKAENFYKSDELDVVPGTFADIYRNVECDGKKWYVKLFISDDGDAAVQVLSANWEDYPH